MINLKVLSCLLVLVYSVQASDASRISEKQEKLVNSVEALAAYKEGMRYLDLSSKEGLEPSQVKILQKQALDAFIQAEKLNPQLFKVQYQLAVMYKDGKAVSKNLLLAEKYANKAIAAARQNTDDRKMAEDLKELIQDEQAHQKISSGKRIEAKYLADQGFEKLRKFQNPPQDSSVEGFDREALLLLGKSSILDSTNFEVEYALADMYLNGIGTRVDLIAAKDHAKKALKIAQNLNNDELIEKAQNFIWDHLYSDGDGGKKAKRKTIAFMPTTLRDGEDRDRSDGKRKSVFDLLRPRSESDSN